MSASLPVQTYQLFGIAFGCALVQCSENMLTYRLTRSIAALPLGSTQVIFLPAGTLIKRDDFLTAVGITDVFLDGRRISVIVQDLIEGSELELRCPVPLDE